MDNMKIAEMLFKIEMDDLKDAETIVDYAKKINECGDESLSQAMLNRAKARLAQLQETKQTIKNVMARIKEEKITAGETYIDGGIYQNMLETYIEQWTSRIKMEIEAM